MYVFIHRDILGVGNYKSNGHKVLREHRKVSSESSGAAGDHLELGGSPGVSIIENLKLDLVKPFKPE